MLSTGPRCSASWPVWTRRTVRFFCGRVRRRQQQWHARGWLCWLNVSHAVFPSLSAGLLVSVFNVPAMSVAYLATLSPVASRDTTGIVVGQARFVSITSVACSRLVLLVFMLASLCSLRLSACFLFQASWLLGEVAALVIDIVSGTIMAGFDGDDTSAAFFVCGRPMISASWAVWRWPRSSVCGYGFVGTDCAFVTPDGAVPGALGSLTPGVFQHGARPSSLDVRIF